MGKSRKDRKQEATTVGSNTSANRQALDRERCKRTAEAWGCNFANTEGEGLHQAPTMKNSTNASNISKRRLRRLRRKAARNEEKKEVKKQQKHLRSLSNSQVAKNKLMRSIIKKQVQQNKRNGAIFKETKDTEMPLVTKDIHTSTEIEDGEIVSVCVNPPDDKTLALCAHDDCILIEPGIDLIIVDDDDTITESSHITADFMKLTENPQNGLTSTPSACVKDKTLSSDMIPLSVGSYVDEPSCSNSFISEIENPHELSDSRPLFFVDTGRNSSCETIIGNANYVTRSLIGHCSVPKKRSKRLEGKSLNTNADTSDIIFVDETLDLVNQPYVKQRRTTELADDSVVFISESKSPNMPEYISLVDKNVPNPLQIDPSNPCSLSKNIVKQTKSAASRSLFSKSEIKQLDAYNNNAYNPSAGTQTKTQKRMVIVDGSNVAFHHGRNQNFSVKGIEIVIDYFEKNGHDVKVVIPLFRSHKCTDREVLDQLHKLGKIVYTPCKNLPGKSSTSYDDRFVLQLACELDAAIVSNDNYRDLIHENSAFKKIIENRVIGYSWCDDMFILPKDPYGRHGPQLHSILNRK